MFKSKVKPILAWSTFSFVLLSLFAIFQSAGNPPMIIQGTNPDYTITLDSTNSPTTSTAYVNTFQMVRYADFNYENVKASSGNHTELSSNGGIYSSQITSITNVTATFTTLGSLMLYTTYDEVNYFEYSMVSGVSIEFANLPYFVEFWAGEEPVTIESIVINYTCSPHEESLDKYSVTWLNDDMSVLETDINVDPGTFPSYDSPLPTKDAEGSTLYTFDGWDQELSEVYNNQTYVATYAAIDATFNLINDNNEYMLTAVLDNTLTYMDIPSTYLDYPVTAIDDEVFAEFTNLEFVNLPYTLTSIGLHAFYRCIALTSISIPESVNFIGNEAFMGCNSLTAINADADNLVFASLDGVLFNKALTQLLTYPAGKGTTYAIPSSVTLIGEGAFIGSTLLTMITIPSSVMTIESNAFIACSALENIIIPDSVTTMGSGVFVNCTGLTSAILSSGLTALPNALFFGCSSLETVSIPNSITTIGNQVFENCVALATVNLPENLTLLGTSAFYGCSALTNITLPATLLEIESSAFRDCALLTQITIPGSVTTLGQYIFVNCSLLSAINVESSNMNFSSLDGVLFNKDMTAIISYPTGKTNSNYVIPASVTTILSNAFRDNPHLTSVYIPNTVTTIEFIGFGYCDNLTINCQVSAPLAGWNDGWNYSSRPVVWNYVI